MTNIPQQPIHPAYGAPEERRDYLEGLPQMDAAAEGVRVIHDWTKFLELIATLKKEGKLTLQLPDDDPENSIFFLERMLERRERIALTGVVEGMAVVGLNTGNIDPNYPKQMIKPYHEQPLPRVLLRVHPTGSEQFPQFSTNGAKGEGLRPQGASEKTGLIGKIWPSESDKNLADLAKGRTQAPRRPTTASNKFGEVLAPESAFASLTVPLEIAFDDRHSRN